MISPSDPIGSMRSPRRSPGGRSLACANYLAHGSSATVPDVTLTPSTMQLYPGAGLSSDLYAALEQLPGDVLGLFAGSLRRVKLHPRLVYGKGELRLPRPAPRSTTKMGSATLVAVVAVCVQWLACSSSTNCCGNCDPHVRRGTVKRPCPRSQLLR